MSKKNIIAIIAIVVLLFIAGISVGMFLYNNAQTEAVEGNQVIEENQVTGGNQTETEVQGNGNNENAIINPEQGEGEGDTTTPNEGNDDAEQENNENQEATGNENANNTVTGNVNEENDEEDDDEVTTDTNVNEVGETTITRVEEQERLVSEGFWDWWQPMDVTVTRSELGVQLPQITVKKSAITGVGEDHLVYAGQNITYVIDVTNNGDIAVENIEITDKIPQNTTFVSIEDAKISDEVVGTKTTIETENEIVGVKWVVTIPAGETVRAKFTVNVNKTMLDVNNEEIETTGTIYNTAIANGEESNDGEPTKTSIIKTNKTSEITRNNEKVEIAKMGDLITYKITVENTGDIEGTTYIEDTVPEGTKFVSAQEGAIVSEEQDTVLWSVTVPAGKSATREFTVEVINVDGEIRNVAKVEGTSTNEDIVETANINVEKVVTDIKRDGESIETDAEVKEGDVIEYTITVINTGSVDLTNVVLEEKLIGVVVDAEKLQIGDLAAGDSKVINATYTVTYERDIKDKEDRIILNEVYVSGETVTENPDEIPEKVDDEDDVITPVEEAPSVSVVKEADKEIVKAGDIINYTITVTNTGNVTLENIPVTDKLTTSAGEQTLKLYTDTTYTTEVTSISKLEVTQVVTLYAKYEVKQEDIDAQKVITNVATANETPSNEVPVTPEEPNKELSVNKEIQNNGEPYGFGEVVEYKVTVTNTGNMTLTNVKLTDKINNVTDITTVVEINENGEDVETRDLTTYEFTLAPKQSAYFKYTYTVTEADIAIGKITNVATATAPDTEPGTDTKTVDTEDTIPLTNITLEKGIAEEREGTFVEIAGDELANKVYSINDIVWYSIKVTNNHVAPGTVTVTDILPKGIKYEDAKLVDKDGNIVSANIETPSYNSDEDRYTVTWKLDNLASNTSETIYIKATITENAIKDMTPKTTTITPSKDKRIDFYNINNIATAVNQSSNVDITVKDETQLVSKTVTKVWADNQNEDGDRPGTVTVQLLPTGETAELKQSNQWTYTWSGLEPKDANGIDIVYTVNEIKVGTEDVIENRTSKYITSQSTDSETGVVTITNTYDPEIVATKISKTDKGTITVEEGKQPVKSGETAIKIGDVITYTIQLENKGNVSKTATVKDTIPAHTELVEGTTIYLNKVALTEAQIEQFYAGTLVVTVGPNSTSKITFNVKVTSGNAGDEVTNTAIVNDKPVGPTVNPIEKLVNVTKYKNNIASTNIVLVLDTSSSMLRYPNSEKSAPEGSRRIDVAKNAINAFVENTYKIEKNADVTFTLITFNHRDNTELFTFNDGTNANAWMATKSTQSQFKTAVSKITTGKGTNMRAGLEVAYNTLYGTSGISTINEYKNFERILIFFGDGEPYGETSDGGLNTAEGIKAQADLIRNRGTKMYSIGFGPDVTPGETGYDRLSDIADGGVVYNSSNYETLVTDFSRIAGKDPSYDQITVDGSAIINITSNVQDIIVDVNNPIIITVGETTTTIVNAEQAAANNITYTTKNITWNVSGYAESATLSISYNVQ